jgi:type II secretory pathway component PulJ
MTLCGRNSFTLLELLVALAVFVLLATVLVSALLGVTGSWQRLGRENARMQELLVLDRTLDRMLSNALPLRWADEEEQPFVVFRGDREEVLLVYRHVPGSFQEGSLRFVLLRVDSGRLEAVYQDRPVLSTEKLFPDAAVSVLAQDVERIECSYADRTARDGALRWLDRWDPEQTELEFPAAIALHVQWLDGREECWLRRTAGSGYREVLGAVENAVRQARRKP